MTSATPLRPRLLRYTGNLKLVTRLLGHTQIETTMRYAHVLDGDMRDGLDGYAVLSRVPKISPKMAEKWMISELISGFPS